MLVKPKMFRLNAPQVGTLYICFGSHNTLMTSANLSDLNRCIFILNLNKQSPYVCLNALKYFYIKYYEYVGRVLALTYVV